MRYKVIHRPFPTDDIHGAVLELESSKYLILINSNIPEEEQKEALKHELYHIEHGHFEQINKGERTLSQIEAETHKAIEGR